MCFQSLSYSSEHTKAIACVVLIIIKLISMNGIASQTNAMTNHQSNHLSSDDRFQESETFLSVNNQNASTFALDTLKNNCTIEIISTGTFNELNHLVTSAPQFKKLKTFIQS